MRLLLIERHQLLARLLKRGLEEDGFSVTVVRDAEEGSFQVTTETYDVILFDLHRPNESCRPLLQQRGSNGRQTPVLVLTARDDTEEELHALGLGAEDYLTIPFQLEELLSRLGTLTRRRPRGHGPSPAQRPG